MTAFGSRRRISVTVGGHWPCSGVIPLREMSVPHAVTCLAKLAELANPAITLPDWCATVRLRCHCSRARVVAPWPRVCHRGRRPPLRSPVADRVRAVLITPDDQLLTIKRVRPGQDPYWVLPGGGVGMGEDLETALARELREELAATADVHSLVYVLERGDERQYFYLARVRAWSADASDRDGPEFTAPARGEYHPQAIPLTAQALAAIDLKPAPLADFLLGHLRADVDLFSLPDLRASMTERP